MKKTFLLLSLILLWPTSLHVHAMMEEDRKEETEDSNHTKAMKRIESEELIQEYRNTVNNGQTVNTTEDTVITKLEEREEIEADNVSENVPLQPGSHLGYLPLHVKPLIELAGEPKSLLTGFLTSTYRQLIKTLADYEDLPKSSSIEERLSYLSTLEEITKEYLSKKENSLFKDTISANYSPGNSNTEQTKNRILACSLLLSGIERERSSLEDTESNDQPKKGVRLDRRGKPVYYKENAASGSLSSLSYIKVGEKEFLFKQFSNKRIPDLIAQQLNFSEELINNSGVSEIMANFSGRELATYAIAKELSKSTGIELVPEAFLAALGEKPNQIMGTALRFINGNQLCEEQIVKVSEEELARLFSKSDHQEREALKAQYIAEVACGITSLPSEWKLYFSHDSLEYVSDSKPLHEGGKPVSFERAQQLAQQGELAFNKREIFSVNQEINFREPLIQKILNQIHLLLLLTGEFDSHPLNFIFFQDENNNWRVVSIDHDLSFSSNFSDTSDEVIEKLRNTKEVKHVVKMPPLIDQKMGDTILELTPEREEQLISKLITRPTEIEAAKNRLKTLQEHIRIAKETGRYVYDQPENPEEIKEGRLYWGDETYDRDKDSDRTYLAKFLGTKEHLKQKLEGSIRAKIELQQEIVNKAAAELDRLHAELQRAQGIREKKQEHLTPDSYTPCLVPTKKPRSSSIASSIGTQETSLTDLLPHITQATLIQVLNSYLLLKKELENQEFKMPTSIQILMEALFKDRLLPENIDQQKAIFKTNQLLEEAKEHQKIARPFFEQLIEEIISSSNTNNHALAWSECLKSFIKTENSLSFAITSFQDEKKILPSYLLEARKLYEREAQQDKEEALTSILWGQVLRAEEAAHIIFNEEGYYSEKSLRSLLEAQQAWRILISNISPSFSETWEKYFKKAELLKDQLTPFFRYWLQATKMRYQSIVASSNIESGIKNKTEQQHWDNLHQLAQQTLGAPKTETEQDLWKHIIQEIDFQKMYALAQEKTICIATDQDNISKLSRDALVNTTIHTIYPGNRLLSSPLKMEDIAGVHKEKLQELCLFWDRNKIDTTNMKRSWLALVEYAAKNLTTPNDLQKEKPLEEQNTQALEASFSFKANNALELAALAEKDFPKIENSTPKAYSHRFDQTIQTRDFDFTHHQLSKARAEINSALSLSPSCETRMWKPSFPTKKLERLEETGSDSHHNNSLSLEDQQHQHLSEIESNYVIFNVFEEEIMRSLLKQIDQFEDCSLLKNSLSEMIDGEPDFVREEVIPLIEKLIKAKDSISEKLDLMED